MEVVFGDSWTAARESDTKLDKGWPFYLGVEEGFRQGVSGSRADQWAADHNGWLTKVKNTKAPVAIVSLLGNDLSFAMRDGKVTWQEKFTAFQNMQKVLREAGDGRERVIVLQYANPLIDKKNSQYEMAQTVVPLLNSGIALCCVGIPNVELVDLGEWLSDDLNDGHFDGKDIHPTVKGHMVIAEKMAEIL